MPRPIEQLPQIRSAIGFYRVMSWVTGIFLLLLVGEMVLKYSPLHFEIFAFGASGPLALEAVVPTANCQWYSLFVPGGMGCKLHSVGEGVNISTGILIAHGWLYVVYILASFRLWSALRWPFRRLLAMAAGGVVPMLSFFVERRMHRIAVNDLAALEAERAALDAAAPVTGSVTVPAQEA